MIRFNMLILFLFSSNLSASPFLFFLLFLSSLSALLLFSKRLYAALQHVYFWSNSFQPHPTPWLYCVEASTQSSSCVHCRSWCSCPALSSLSWWSRTRSVRVELLRIASHIQSLASSNCRIPGLFQSCFTHLSRIFLFFLLVCYTFSHLAFLLSLFESVFMSLSLSYRFPLVLRAPIFSSPFDGGSSVLSLCLPFCFHLFITSNLSDHCRYFLSCWLVPFSLLQDFSAPATQGWWERHLKGEPEEKRQESEGALAFLSTEHDPKKRNSTNPHMERNALFHFWVMNRSIMLVQAVSSHPLLVLSLFHCCPFAWSLRVAFVSLCSDFLAASGADGIWCDMNEPSSFCKSHPFFRSCLPVISALSSYFRMWLASVISSPFSSRHHVSCHFFSLAISMLSMIHFLFPCSSLRWWFLSHKLPICDWAPMEWRP